MEVARFSNNCFGVIYSLVTDWRVLPAKPKVELVEHVSKMKGIIQRVAQASVTGIVDHSRLTCFKFPIVKALGHKN